ncbi:MAG TPA: argininosuccinate lyase [Firmicutes bacterium]|nr:argininosuccinate lyase [Bacillota bacterium]
MKLWGGRFAKNNDELMEDFHSSITFDKRLYREDIAGSLAHSAMLAKQGIISEEEGNAIRAGLQSILKDIDEGHVEFDIKAEDIHMNVETMLIERIGDVGKKLHTGRSRNDQVALDIRLYMKRETDEVIALLADLNETLITMAEQHRETVMPGYTHLQKAQPITFAHHLMAYFEMFLRDMGRLQDSKKRLDSMVLGSGALAGTVFPLDRNFVAEQLGFGEISHNSLDGVSDRDFALEFLAAASTIMMHLSRFSEEIIFWSSGEFGFVTLDDGYSTGSSIMPQKKNPDAAELVRGKTGRVYGDLMALLTVMKGIPLAYNKDMQEDKEALFDAVDTVKKCLMIFKPMVATLTIHEERMRNDAEGGFINATDAADYLAERGVPFREAHAVVGSLILHCEKEGKALKDLTIEEWKAFSPVFSEDIYDFVTIEKSVQRRQVPGGPAPQRVQEAIAAAKQRLEAMK